MKLRLVTGLAALAALGLVPSASASTTIGQLPPGAAAECGGGTVFLQGSTGAAPGYTVPAGGGVITSWSTKAGTQTGQTGALKVLTITDATHYTVAGSSPVVPVTASTINAFPVRIPVTGGETLGYYFPVFALQDCDFSSANAADSTRYVGGDHPEPGVGDPQTTDGVGNSRRINIRAVVEPDADKDQYGDETQDLCPTNATLQIACPATVVPGAAPFVPVDKAKPTIGSFAFSASTFKAAKSGASISAKSKSKAKVGTKVSFSLSEPGSVKFSIDRKTKGRKLGRKCMAKTKANAKKKSCTRWVKVAGSFTYAGKAGKNTFTFRGRVGGKSLKPGSYRLNSQATDKAKNKSQVKRKSFKIVQ